MDSRPTENSAKQIAGYSVLSTLLSGGADERAIHIIETQTFTKCFSRLATDRDLFVVQAKILSDPRVGNLIRGGHGLRKIRAPFRNHGAQGGARIIYYFDERYTVYLLLAYSKATKVDLTAFELKMLSQLVTQLKEE